VDQFKAEKDMIKRAKINQALHINKGLE